MANGTGRNEGRVMDVSDPGTVEGRLFGFGIDSAALGSKHCSWLDSHVVPMLAGGGSISVYGLASRSGSAAHNLALSKRRASAVLAYLRRKVRRHISYSVKQIDAYGERLAAEVVGQKDGTEDPFYRAVHVYAWPRPTPPPPKPKSKSKSKHRRP